jgi:hypothetical protein
MATVKPVVLVALAACGNVEGFGGPVPPIVSFEVTATGDLASVRPPGDPGTPNLHAALVWGRQWLVEPLCILPPENDAAAAVIAKGCRDPFGFVPALVGADVPIEIGTPATIDLYTRPGTDVMVGDLTARVAYASIVIYDDKDANDTLNLAVPNRPQQPGPMGGNDVTQVPDIVYGASFSAMTSADVRVAYREGTFIQSGFYPRAGCGDPMPGFSVLAAGGFTADAAVQATLAGTLPLEPDGSCAEQLPAAATFTVPVQPPAGLTEMKCTERITDSSVRYREPGADPPADLDMRTIACVHVPSFGAPSDVIELVITGRPDDSCVGLTHYILKGCREGPQCGSPDWDDAPPSWWPC